MPKSNLILCGMPLSGKNAIGEMLSEKLDYTFIEIDRLIEEIYFRQFGTLRTVREIFQDEGEQLFRDLESEAVEMASKCQNTIISLGGVTFLSKEGRDALKKYGLIVYLKASLNTLNKRLIEELPSAIEKEDSEGTLKTLLETRESHYKSSSDLEFEIDNLSNEEIVQALSRLIEKKRTY